jgi:predicted 2-oxoglutarate/Fe(II)-dependent dioxygenase YbiX
MCRPELRGAWLLAWLRGAGVLAGLRPLVLRARVCPAWLRPARLLARLLEPFVRESVLRQPVLLALVREPVLRRSELRLAVLRLSVVRLAQLRIAWLRVAVVRVALLRLSWLRVARLRLAELRLAVLRVAVVRVARLLHLVREARQATRGDGAGRSRPGLQPTRARAPMITPELLDRPRFPGGDVSRILVAERALSTATCKEIVAHATANASEILPALIGAGAAGRVDRAVRSTGVVPTRTIARRMNFIVGRLLAAHIEPFFGRRVEWWERPRLLRYAPGDRYGLHADADRRVEVAPGRSVWRRHLDRDVSFILYVNGAFTGGKLNFPAQGLKIEPKEGMVVAFPSSAAYLHEAEPTESGQRFAVVSWAALVGGPRVNPRPTDVVFKRNGPW